MQGSCLTYVPFVGCQAASLVALGGGSLLWQMAQHGLGDISTTHKTTKLEDRLKKYICNELNWYQA